MLGSIGVVYGDIGTSPLYAFREALAAAEISHGVIQPADVFGVVSLILWALIFVVTIKYVLVLLRADNDGEGGTLSLMALAQRAVSGRGMPILLLGVAGASLFYGDALITPAISVLSAVEGVKLIAPAAEPVVLPVTVAIIIVLFLLQSRGTGSVAAWFGPITLVWFAVMAVGGIRHIADDPAILWAFNPAHAVNFLFANGKVGLIALGAVFLAVTGAEALYADLGHFGRRPIQLAWLCVVAPALMLNYLGQGALVLAKPDALANPFFLLYPAWALIPVVMLATIATVIASQAVITGAYSLTQQAIQLRLLPRLEIRHTSAEHAGQIYMPQINTLLLVGVLLLVFLFGSSAALATAYGIAVTGTMVVTTCLAFMVVRHFWHWPLWAALVLLLPLLSVDIVFLGANLLKVAEGGFVPLLIALGVAIVMLTWQRGTGILFAKTRRSDVPLADLVETMARRPPHRVSGLAVFLTSDPETTPSALLHSLKHYKVLHAHNAILTIVTRHQPRVPDTECAQVTRIDDNFTRITLTFGFMDQPDVPRALRLCRDRDLTFEPMATSFFLSRRALRPAGDSDMPLWQDKLFILLANNASDATEYFRIPTGRVVEIGTQIAV